MDDRFKNAKKLKKEYESYLIDKYDYNADLEADSKTLKKQKFMKNRKERKLMVTQQPMRHEMLMQLTKKKCKKKK